MRSRRQDSFKAFEANTSDAWDDGDDDLMKLASAARQQLSKKNLKSVYDAQSVDGLKLSAGSDSSANVNSPVPASFVSPSGMDWESLFLISS